MVRPSVAVIDGGLGGIPGVIALKQAAPRAQGARRSISLGFTEASSVAAVGPDRT